MINIIAPFVIPSLLIYSLDDIPEPPVKKTALDQMFGDLLAPRTSLKTTREKTKEEIVKYRERPFLDLSGDVLQWWRHQGDLPLLAALAKHYLSIPATSVASERI